MWGKEELPPSGPGSQAPPQRAGVYSHRHRPQQLQDALPVPLLGCVELLGADANNLRPGDKMPLHVNGHSSHPSRRTDLGSFRVNSSGGTTGRIYGQGLVRPKWDGFHRQGTEA